MVQREEYEYIAVLDPTHTSIHLEWKEGQSFKVQCEVLEKVLNCSSKELRDECWQITVAKYLNGK